MCESTWRCTVCGKVKPTSEFPRDKSHSNGHKGRCRICTNALASSRRGEADRLKDRAQIGRYRSGEAPGAVMRVCAVCGVPFGIKPSEKTRKACSRACGYRLHPAMPNATCIVCGVAFHLKPNQKRAENCCSYACMGVAYRERFRGAVNPNYRGGVTYDEVAYRRVHNNKRRVAQNAGGPNFTAAEWNTLCARFKHRCVACGKNHKLAADHILPVSLGGSNSIENIQPLCKSCNSSKHAKLIDYRQAPRTGVTHLQLWLELRPPSDK